MRYISTRGLTDSVPFQDAVMMGQAPDGGLMLPESIPDVRGKLEEWRNLSFQDLAFNIFKLYIDDIPDEDLKSIIHSAYSTFTHPQVTPVVPLGNLWILELFHGPSISFKDVALQFLANTFDYVLNKRNEKLNILGATSGDTGGAAIYAMRGKERINVIIMHPDGRVSPLQKIQMTTVLDKNVHNLAVKGSFDDCQGIMKSIFNELEFKEKYKLGTINSINWGRLLAQTVYYFAAYYKVAKGTEEVNFAVPTGNFGDIFAGYISKKMGLPINKLVLATNENDILSRFFNTGEYKKGDVHFTVSPSMDIQIASNFERYLYYRAGCDPALVREWINTFNTTGSLKIETQSDGVFDKDISAGTGNTDQTLKIIKQKYDEFGYVLDPHTAVGVFVAESLPLVGTTVCLSTAHPAKFDETIQKAINSSVTHPSLESARNLPIRCHSIDSDKAAVMEYIAKVVNN